MSAASAPPVHVLMVRLGHILDAMRLDLQAYASTGDREHLDHAHEGLMRALELRDQIERWL